jgi:hypothetical protein
MDAAAGAAPPGQQNGDAPLHLPPPPPEPAPPHALALVPQPGGGTNARQERALALTTSKEIDSMHGDEISRRLAEFATGRPTGIYSRPRSK